MGMYFRYNKPYTEYVRLGELDSIAGNEHG